MQNILRKVAAELRQAAKKEISNRPVKMAKIAKALIGLETLKRKIGW